MGQERLCGLALLHIHTDKVDSTEGYNERVLKRWDATEHRKIGKLWNKRTRKQWIEVMLHQKRIKFDFWLTNEHKLR